MIFSKLIFILNVFCNLSLKCRIATTAHCLYARQYRIVFMQDNTDCRMQYCTFRKRRVHQQKQYKDCSICVNTTCGFKIHPDPVISGSPVTRKQSTQKISTINDLKPRPSGCKKSTIPELKTYRFAGNRTQDVPEFRAQ